MWARCRRDRHLEKWKRDIWRGGRETSGDVEERHMDRGREYLERGKRYIWRDRRETSGEIEERHLER
ncbi:hypothetical protein BgiBS90_020002 [Biomphalaria glabrata]|nr:hypothetical protein BgiBS90_020002 [Biomphalaria glabrata]